MGTNNGSLAISALPGFYFPHYLMFSSVEPSPFIQLCESQPISYCTEGEKNYASEKEMFPYHLFPFDAYKQICHPWQQSKMDTMHPPNSQINWSFLKSLQVQNIILSPFLCWPPSSNRYPCQRRTLELGVCLT